MNLHVQTGATRSADGTALISRSFSDSGENACLLLQIRTSTGNVETLEQECVNVLKHSLLGTEGEPWSRLDGTLKELNGLFKGLLVSQNVAEIHAVIALVDRKGEMHVSHAGRGEGWLLRSGTASQITEYSRGKPIPNFVHISSGALEPGDIVIFSTQRLMRALTPAQLAQVAASGDDLLEELTTRLQGETEMAALAVIQTDRNGRNMEVSKKNTREEASLPSRRGSARIAPPSRSDRRRGNEGRFDGVLQTVSGFATSILGFFSRSGGTISRSASSRSSGVSDRFTSFLADLRDPRRARKAQLLLLAGVLGAFLIIWMLVRLSTMSQRSKNRDQLQQLLDQATEELQTAENRRISGDIVSANAILEQAETQTKQVIDNESGLFRGQAADLLARIKDKREKINNITRISSLHVSADLSAKNPSISPLGLIGISDNKEVAYDAQQSYDIISGSVSDPVHLMDQELIAAGTAFPRYQSEVFLTSGNSLIELVDGQPIDMKTDDINGWMGGKDIETYARFLYVLSPSTKQIYKYERLTNRYSAPSNYNVNADLSDAIDMTIDSSVYVLKADGTILKLLRGQTQPFVIRQLPAGLLTGATKIFKMPGGNFYVLNPAKSSIIVLTDGGATGESSYVRQYVLDDPNVTKLQDLYVDPDETHLYVMDQKKVYQIDAIK